MMKQDQLASPNRITRRKLSDQVFDRLRAMIASGELPAGSYMPSERALMERFSVGRPAVREALQHLHTTGLITISDGERSRVNALSAGMVLASVDDMARIVLSSGPEQVEHLKQARRMFECGLVRVAAENATAQDVRDLRELVGEQRARIGEAEAFVAADLAFHGRIAQISANPILAATSHAMLSWLLRYHGVLLHWSGKEKITLQEHDQIVDLIAARDAEGAVAAMQAHLDRSNPLIQHANGAHPLIQ